MSCVGLTGQGIARGRSCGQGVGRGKGHALKSGRGVQNKRALIGRWLERDDDLMRSSPFSDSPSSHHLTFTLKALFVLILIVVVDCTLDIIGPIFRPIINKPQYQSLRQESSLRNVLSLVCSILTLPFGWLALLSRAPFFTRNFRFLVHETCTSSTVCSYLNEHFVSQSHSSPPSLHFSIISISEFLLTCHSISNA